MKNRQKGFVIPLIITIIALLLIIGGGVYVFVNKSPLNSNSTTTPNIEATSTVIATTTKTKPPVACTMEAKLCPDGTAVGRTGPNCEFSPCPGAVAPGYVSGQVTIGPFCPVERVGVPCPTPVEAYTSREAIIYAADGITIKDRQNLDTSGNYKIALPPGNYFVQISPAGIGAGEKKSVTVKSAETSVVDFNIDTGIR
jgi:hypothetical protein